MLDTLFQRPHHLQRLRANPISAVLDSFAEYLLLRGHARGTIHQFLRAVEHYGHWLGIQHAGVTLEYITSASAQQFLREHLPICSCPTRYPRGLIASRAATNHLLRMLVQREPARVPSRSGPHGTVLAQYESFLERDCGLSEHTRIYRLRNARQFLLRHFGDASPDPSQLNPANIQDYFRQNGHHLKAGSVGVLASSLRSFLRFLALIHGFDSSLAGVVPTAPQWPLDRLPKALPVDELRAIIAYFDTRSATGRRDLAMTRCMSDLGLRVSEVVAVTLDNIDWRSGTMTILGSKGGRSRSLPMPIALGQAISAYLQEGRPRSDDRHLFLRHTVPAGTRVTHTLVRGVFRRAYAAATGHTQSVGTHILRHTAATRMRSEGHSLKDIADVLGHRSVDTTAIYAKLDIESLRIAALPWPGGTS
jgi:integrase/recombinase XerD